MAAIFAALGDETRLTIFSRLGDGSTQSISQLAEGLPLTRQGVTRHLRVLEDARLVQSRRIGRETRYTLDVKAVRHANRYLARASEQWDQAISRLSRHLQD